MSKPIRVIIIGGGIAGLCLAQGLRQAGVEVAVYERDRTPTDRLSGYRIHLNPAGGRALHACLPPALWNRFVDTAGEPGGLGFFSEQLDQLLVITDEDTHGGMTDPTARSHAIDRVRLREILLTDLEEVVSFDKTFTRYEENGDEVTAFFADGTSVTGDLLIGADGINSRVRDQLLPQARPVPTEALSVASRVPLTDATRRWLPERFAASMNMIVAPAPYFLFTSAYAGRVRSDHSPDERLGYILCALVAHRDALPARVHTMDGPALQGVAADLTAGWHPDLRQLATAAEPDTVSLQTHRASKLVAAWPTSYVTVIGDALHTMPPVGGLGGNAALRDAHVLCRTLAHIERGPADLAVALRSVEAEFRTTGYAALRKAVKTQRSGLNAGWLGVAGARAFLRTAQRIPALRRATVPYRDQARPRPWECDGWTAHVAGSQLSRPDVA
jgi:2-polyprenyl-6-methoxyphenol hydroxylase-like FAD-dependent oxidoreductase